MNSACETSDARRVSFIKLGGFFKVAAFGLSILCGVIRVLRGWSGVEGKSGKCVVLEPFGLGDIVTLLPLVRILEDKYRVSFAGQPRWREVMSGEKGVSWVDVNLPWASYSRSSKYSLKRFFSREVWDTFASLRKECRGAVGIDPRGDIRCILVLWLVGCRAVVSFDRYLGTDLSVPGWAAYTIPLECTERRWKNATRLAVGVSGESAATAGRPSLKDATWDSSSQIVGIVPLAPWPGKLWSLEKWRTLIENFERIGMQVICFCGPGQHKHAAEIAGTVQIKEIDSVRGWIDCLAKCRLVLSVDSGPMHVADALGIPTVAIFGQGSAALWGPSGPRSRTVHHQGDPDFQPVHPIMSNVDEGQKWMDKVTVEEVMEAARPYLETGSERIASGRKDFEEKMDELSEKRESRSE